MCAFFHLKYVLLFGLAFKSDFGASCTASDIYRKHLSINFLYLAPIFLLMFIGNFVVFLFIMLFNTLGHLNISKHLACTET
jgi:hypothetical protein